MKKLETSGFSFSFGTQASALDSTSIWYLSPASASICWDLPVSVVDVTIVWNTNNTRINWAISWDYGTFILRKLIHQTHMHSHPVGLDVWFWVKPFVYFQTSSVRTANALTVKYWAFTGRLCDKYHNLMSRLNLSKAWNGAWKMNSMPAIRILIDVLVWNVKFLFGTNKGTERSTEEENEKHNVGYNKDHTSNMPRIW